jgi:hypothetical protein
MKISFAVISNKHAASRQVQNLPFVFLVDGSSESRFTTTLRQVALRLEIMTVLNEDDELNVSLPTQWLCKDENGNQLMIMDDVYVLFTVEEKTAGHMPVLI